MKTLAIGYLNGEKVSIIRVWNNTRTGKVYCEAMFNEERGIRIDLNSINLLQWIS